MEIQGKYLKAASMFMGKNDLRSYLNGVYAEVSYDQLILTAPDGRRMLSIRLDVEPGQRTTKFIIPASLLKDVKPKLTAYLSISDDAQTNNFKTRRLGEAIRSDRRSIPGVPPSNTPKNKRRGRKL